MVKIKWVDGKETTFHYVLKAEPISPELLVLKDMHDKIRYYVPIKNVLYVANDQLFYFS